jgi:hypothetical protein
MIKFFVRWAIRLILLGVVLIVAFVLLRDQILREVVETQLSRGMGMEVTIGSLSTKLTRPIVTAKNVVIYNTAAFGGGPFLDIPDLHLEWSADARGRADLHFKVARVNIQQFNIVENKEGRTNITDISAALQKVHTVNTNEPGVRFNGIDTLNLSVGNVRYINLRRPERTQEMNLALQNEIVQNVRTWDDMAGLLFKILIRAGFNLYIDQVTNRPPVGVKPPPPVQQPATRR